MPQEPSMTPRQRRLNDALKDKRLPLTKTQRDDIWDATHQQEDTDPDQMRQTLAATGVPRAAYAAGTPLAIVFGLDRPGPPGAVSRGLDWAAKQGTDLLVGGVKGAADTAMSLGGLVQKIPGVSRAVDALYGQPGLSRAAFSDESPLRQDLQPTNTGEKLGYGAEKIGEFFIPVAGPVTKALGASRLAAKAPAIINNLPTIRRGLEGVAAGGLTLAQGGSPTAALVSGGLAAALPGTGTGRMQTVASDALRKSAEKEVAQALGATKEVFKDKARELAPQILRGVQSNTGRTLVKGVSGSRQAMLNQAEAQSSQLGATLQQAYVDAAAAGKTVDGATIDSALANASSAFYASNAAGKAIAIPGTEGIIAQLGKLRGFVAKLGPDIPVDKAAHIKRTWDAMVEKAGLFGAPQTASASDKAVANATKSATDSFRALLNANPTISDLNKELSFWIGLRKVLTATERRTQAQGPGLIQAGMGGAGFIAGAVSGDSAIDKAEKALIGGLAGKQLVQMMQSPYFRTVVAGPFKDKLAAALASGSTGDVVMALSKMASAFPSVLSRPAPVPAGGQISVTGLEVGN